MCRSGQFRPVIAFKKLQRYVILRSHRRDAFWDGHRRVVLTPASLYIDCDHEYSCTRPMFRSISDHCGVLIEPICLVKLFLGDRQVIAPIMYHDSRVKRLRNCIEPSRSIETGLQRSQLCLPRKWGSSMKRRECGVDQEVLTVLQGRSIIKFREFSSKSSSSLDACDMQSLTSRLALRAWLLGLLTAKVEMWRQGFGRGHSAENWMESLPGDINGIHTSLKTQ